MSVDVEDWFHDGGVAGDDPAARRVERNTEALLAQFADAGARATFFVLGAVAERYPVRGLRALPPWLLRIGRERMAPRLAALLRERRFVSIREAFRGVAA
jgi:hypothetical protein